MNQKKEHFKNILVAASATLPFVGGPLSVIIDKYLPLEIEKRRNSFIDQLSTDFVKYENQINSKKIQSPEYSTTFLKVLQRVVSEHRDEKLISFRNILINDAISTSDEFDELTFYIRLIEDLTVDQIRILHYIHKGKLKGHSSENSKNSIYHEIQEQWTDIDKHYLSACITELLRTFLISSSSEVLKKENSNTQHALTDFGKRFVSYIFTPIEMKD